MFKDCQGLPYPVYGTGNVSSVSAVKGAVPEKSVYELKVVMAIYIPGVIKVIKNSGLIVKNQKS